MCAATHSASSMCAPHTRAHTLCLLSRPQASGDSGFPAHLGHGGEHSGAVGLDRRRRELERVAAPAVEHHRRVGPERLREVLSALDAGDAARAADALLGYYDRLYERTIAARGGCAQVELGPGAAVGAWADAAEAAVAAASQRRAPPLRQGSRDAMTRR